MRRVTTAIRRLGAPMLAAALGFLTVAADGQETLPVPSASTVPSINTSQAAVPLHPPRPSVIEVLSSAKRSLCAHMRASPICQLVGGLRTPLSTLTGGLVPAQKEPHPEDQAQPGPEGTAAQIKAVKLQAPKRQAAVKSLQGIDVRYHPEAEAALIGALRVDPSDCVRLEAAKTILTLPVCSQAISEALRVCVDGTDVDGNPAELSEAVRMQAEIASMTCQSCLPHSTPAETDRPEYPVGDVAQAGALMPIGAVESTVLPISSVLLSQSRSAEPAPLEINRANMQPLRSPSDSSQAHGKAVQPQSTARPKPRNLMDVFQAATK